MPADLETRCPVQSSNLVDSSSYKRTPLYVFRHALSQRDSKSKPRMRKQNAKRATHLLNEPHLSMPILAPGPGTRFCRFRRCLNSTTLKLLLETKK